MGKILNVMQLFKMEQKKQVHRQNSFNGVASRICFIQYRNFNYCATLRNP